MKYPFFIKFLCFFFLLPAFSLQTGRPHSYLASSSQLISLPSLPKETKQMVVWELLKTLALDQLEQNPYLEIQGIQPFDQENTVVKIKQKLSEEPFHLLKKGPAIIAKEFAPLAQPIDQLELLYNSQGYLIAIFPALSLVHDDPDPCRRWYYIDLSPYYFELPAIGDPKAPEKWKELALQQIKDIKIIEGYLRENKVTDYKLLSLDYVDCFRSDKAKYPYVYIEFPKQRDPSSPLFSNQKITLFGFFPDGYPHSFPLDPEKHQLIIPVYPTVFSPALWPEQDTPYYQAAYYGIKPEYAPSQGDSACVGGTGCGLDTWLTFLKTKTKVYAFGLNALEVANTRLLSKIAGFDVCLEIHNNLIDPQNREVFKGKQFKHFRWNMPALGKDKEKLSDISLNHLWDNHFYNEDWNRFFKGLQSKLLPEGYCLIWNKTSVKKHIPDKSKISIQQAIDITQYLSLFIFKNISHLKSFCFEEKENILNVSL